MNMKHAGGIVAGGVTALALVASGLSVGAQDWRTAITAQQAIACINTAVAARAGLVEEFDIDRRRGRIVCEIEIVAQDGREYDVDIDVATNTVIRNVEDR